MSDTISSTPRSITTQRQDEIEASLSEWRDPMLAIRHDLHQHPELGYEEFRTSEKVAALLENWGYQVTRGLGGTGVVGTLQAGHGKKHIGIRADMDALPIEELTQLPYASSISGKMHACGHDGHTTTLLTAARQLALDKAFNGTLHVIFQPAEENAAGARKMIEDGLFEQFPCDAVFGLHNWPGLSAGHLAFREGPTMASVDAVDIIVKGHGGHGAAPHQSTDPVVASAAIVTALQSIVARNVNPLDAAVVTIGAIHGGNARNVIPDSVTLNLTVRTFSDEIRELVKERITSLVQNQAASFGASAVIDYQRGYPVLVNHAQETEFARQLAVDIFGQERVINELDAITASEDFAYMLEERPGTYLYIGNGDSASLHSPHYVFNDDILPIAASYWVQLVERFLS